MELQSLRPGGISRTLPVTQGFPEVPDYCGPADGLSHYNPRQAHRVRTLARAAMSLVERIEIRGEEKIPTSGAHLIAINHQTYFDAPTMAVASPKDIRFMAAQDQFSGLVGKAMTALGTFPVDQKHPTQAIETSITLLNQGLRVGIYPQGRLTGETAEVTGFKEGAALIALKSGCESVVPVAIHYSHPQPGFAASAAGYAAGAAVTATALAAALYGGPLTQVVTGVVTGALSGAVLGGTIEAATVPSKNIKTLALGALRGAGKGAVTGAALGGLGAAYLPGNLWMAAPLSGLSGLTTTALGYQLAHRQKAEVSVGDGIDLAPYRAMKKPKEARARLTADMQRAVADLKSQLQEAKERA